MGEGRFRPKLKLSGKDGNAFAVLGSAERALEKAVQQGKLPKSVVEDYLFEAKEGDYNHLLQVTMRYCDVS